MAIATIAQRTAHTTWEGPLGEGRGVLEGHSGALAGLPVTWAARTERSDGKTSPEELAAAAHSSCFSMALALRLGEHDLTPRTLTVFATTTLADVDGAPTITASHVQVQASVPGAAVATFDQVVDEAAKLCPISRLFAGATITVEAILTD